MLSTDVRLARFAVVVAGDKGGVLAGVVDDTFGVGLLTVSGAKH